MKRSLIIAALAAILSTGAQAHISWNLDNCLARYGQEVKPAKTTNSGDIHYFYAADMSISVIFRNDKVRSILYRKAGEKFTNAEIEILQKKNQAEVLGAEGIEWIQDPDAPKGDKIWFLIRQGNVELQALLASGALNDEILEIRTWDQAAVETEATKQDKLDKLKGL